MEEWYYQFPSLTKRIKVVGDYQRSLAYTGEVRKMLYQLKNNMKFQQLGQLRMVRYFIDGTVIIAKSVFGLDSVEIMVSGRDLLPGVGLCSITLFNVPEVVQPMRYPGEIKPFEVEGVDYIKTYYTADMSSCMGCILEWNMLPNLFGTIMGYEGMTNTEAYKLRNPFVFQNGTIPLWWDSEPYRREFYPTNPRPDDHCLHSFAGNCAAEIVEMGADDGGSFIKWKAYTEYTYNFPHLVFTNILTRTGLGHMEMMPYSGTRIINPDGTVSFSQENCKDTKIIKVDCCHKAEHLRTVSLWWESLPFTCLEQPFMFYRGMKICEIPEEVPLSVLGRLWGFYYAGFRVLPDIHGGCVPFEWTWDGPGRLETSEPYRESAEWFSEDDSDCHSKGTLTITDRCGTTDQVYFPSCCETSTEEMYLLYTSLVMACNQSQDLWVSGGCAPYSWSLSGGGGTINDSGQVVTYTAPATNANCTSNPTITVTDCCGETSQLKLAINCYGGAEYALQDGDQIQDACWWDPSHPACKWTGSYWCAKYNCNGVQTYYTSGAINLFTFHDPLCAVYDTYTAADCATQCALGPHGRCATNSLCGAYGGPPWGLSDTRTVDMKNQGCCPISPLTGLPY